MTLSVASHVDAAAVTIRCHGDLDAASAPDLDRAVDDALRASCPCLALDLSQLSFIDSVGLRSVLAARRRAADAGTAFTLTSPHRPARRVLDLAGL